MANQYTGSLEHKAQSKFGCTARELLEAFAEEQISYMDAQDRLGVTHGTIRKWARKYGLELKGGCQEIDRSEEHENMFFSSEMNAFNFLSRRWA